MNFAIVLISSLATNITTNKVRGRAQRIETEANLYLKNGADKVIQWKFIFLDTMVQGFFNLVGFHFDFVLCLRNSINFYELQFHKFCLHNCGVDSCFSIGNQQFLLLFNTTSYMCPFKCCSTHLPLPGLSQTTWLNIPSTKLSRTLIEPPQFTVHSFTSGSLKYGLSYYCYEICSPVLFADLPSPPLTFLYMLNLPIVNRSSFTTVPPLFHATNLHCIRLLLTTIYYKNN